MFHSNLVGGNSDLLSQGVLSWANVDSGCRIRLCYIRLCRIRLCLSGWEVVPYQVVPYQVVSYQVVLLEAQK